MTRHSSFWDRRRAAVRAEEETARRAAQAEADAAHQEALAEKTDAELLAEFDLPDPETLKAGDDFTAFMVKAVPEHLRRRALRKLWVSKPVLACLDDLVDYADDYTQASAVTSFSTSYEVGKGLRRHIEDVAKKALAIADDKAPEEIDTAPAEDTPAAPEPEQDHIVAEADPQDDTETALPPRRMAFRFEEHSA